MAFSLSCASWTTTMPIDINDEHFKSRKGRHGRKWKRYFLLSFCLIVPQLWLYNLKVSLFIFPTLHSLPAFLTSLRSFFMEQWTGKLKILKLSIYVLIIFFPVVARSAAYSERREEEGVEQQKGEKQTEKAFWYSKDSKTERRDL